MKQQVINGVKVIVLGLALSAGLSYATNWVAPVGNPPGNNADAPINVSNVSQTKGGGLGVTGLINWDKAWFFGDVRIEPNPLQNSIQPDLYVKKLANSTGEHVCADADGRLFLCGNPPPPVDTQCDDGIDNDGDGLVDMSDPGCVSPSDDDETNSSSTQCNDGVDNADPEDSLVDMADPGCTSSSDNDETNGPVGPNTQCNDGIDNDGDGKIDFGTGSSNDKGCTSINDTNEQENVTITYTLNSAGTAMTLLGTPSNFQEICQNCAVITGSPGPRFIPTLGLNQVTVDVIGGGGGGGGASVDEEYYGTLYGPTACPNGLFQCSRRGGGGGGGAGGKTTSTVTVAPGWLYTVTVGSGGTHGIEDAWEPAMGNAMLGAGGDGTNSTFYGNFSGSPYNAPQVNIVAGGGKGGKGAFANGASNGLGGAKGSGLSTTPINGSNGFVKVVRGGFVHFQTTGTNGLDGGNGGTSSPTAGSYGRGGTGGTALDEPSPVCNNVNTCRGDKGSAGAIIISFSI